MSLRELGVLGIGALAGGVLGGAVTLATTKPSFEHPNPHKHPYEVKEPEREGEFSFTYYCVTAHGAFHYVGSHQIQALQAKGYTVRVRDLHDHLTFFKHRPEYLNDFGVVHPLFHTDRRALHFLKKCHRYIVSFEVADTTQIGRDYVEFSNDDRVDCDFLPSTFAVEAYRRSGVMNRLKIVPHGVSHLYSKRRDEIKTDNPTLKTIREDHRIKVLVVPTHSEYRKGWDVALNTMKELRRRGRDIVVVYKTFSLLGEGIVNDLRANMIPYHLVRSWLSEEDMIYLYDSCDVLLHPYRSGGFELQVFEAMARGLPVVVTGWGCILDYANVHNSYMISPKGLVKVFPTGLLGHVGMGAEPDLTHAVELMEFVLDNLDYCKRKAEKNRSQFTAQTWDRVIDIMLEECREIWETS